MNRNLKIVNAKIRQIAKHSLSIWKTQKTGTGIKISEDSWVGCNGRVSIWIKNNSGLTCVIDMNKLCINQQRR